MNSTLQKPLLHKIDCIRLYVSDIEAGLAFYCGQLGHNLIWRTENTAGLRMPGTDTEIVIQTEDKRQEIDFEVDSADDAAMQIEKAGGKIIVPPFDIQIGRCVVVQDPWGNPLFLLDTSKGLLAIDEKGNVIGNVSTRKLE